MRCDFCGGDRSERRFLIAGKAKSKTAYICDVCVPICVEVLVEEFKKTFAPVPPESPAPEAK